ncbi:uncharacterized protein V1516DRAFT_671085 [Lipomyces oligophaga]|uniref:uncharacterized protein n=1 Tax=Lipomyces oligophaga TaxID=45792 RepID=UPI0034CD779C
MSSAVIAVDTLVVGSGPSALTLSYLLNGYEPYYDGELEGEEKIDPIIHELFSSTPGSMFGPVLHSRALHTYLANSHSSDPAATTCAMNGLFDRLAAPNFDFDPNARSQSRIRYKKTGISVPHLVVGSSLCSGGQWACVDEANSRTLSYGEMLSLPGFSFSEFHALVHPGVILDPCTRPPRSDVSAYYSMYPSRVGISDTIRANHTVLSLRRSSSGKTFTVIIQDNHSGRLTVVSARNITLASGIFSHSVPPDPILHPVLDRTSSRSASQEKLTLVIGSGFSAADAVLTCPSDHKVLHLFKWDPRLKPSPLRGCHQESYPEYAGLYKLMRQAAIKNNTPTCRACLKDKHMSRELPLSSRYEGMANSTLLSASPWSVHIRTSSGKIVERYVTEIKTHVGRFGVISYLSSELRAELGLDPGQFWASRHTFRSRIDSRLNRWTVLRKDGSLDETYVLDLTERESSDLFSASHGLELAPGVFVIGSLVGDTLVRYTLGSCVTVAGNILDRYKIYSS